MEHKYFPVFMDITEKRVVVIGGGTIATRRVKTLTEFCERITVVSPCITEELGELLKDEKITWVSKMYQELDLLDADIVIAATNQPEVNGMIKKDCLKQEKETGKTILFNVIDAKENCDFYFPSIVQTKEVVVGINSGGSSPRQTKHVRTQIEKALDCNSIYE